jgi:hypothetical protein
MRLDIVAAPDVAHRRLADPLRRCHGSTTPVRAPFGWDCKVASINPPQPHRLAVYLILDGDYDLGFAGGDGQNDLATQGHLRRCAQGRRPALDLRLLLLGQDAWLTSAGPESTVQLFVGR